MSKREMPDDERLRRSIPGKDDPRAMEFVAHLPRYGVRPGQVIGVLLAPGPGHRAIVDGLHRFGCTCLQLDARASTEQIRRTVEDAGAKLVFTSVDHLEIASQLKVCLAYPQY